MLRPAEQTWHRLHETGEILMGLVQLRVHHTIERSLIQVREQGRDPVWVLYPCLFHVLSDAEQPVVNINIGLLAEFSGRRTSDLSTSAGRLSP